MMTFGNTQLQEAAERLGAKDYRSAHAICMDVLSKDPASAQAYYLLGILTADHANHAKAIELFERALHFNPDHAAALAQMARSHIARLNREAALHAARASAALKPKDAFTLDTLGVVFSRAGLHAEAVPFYAAATAAAPGIADYHYNHGAALQFLGDMEAARAAFEHCLAIDPLETRALSSIVQITRQTAEHNRLAELEAAFTATQDDADHALRTGHALAKAHEDIGNPAEALAWLARAKAKKRQVIRHDPAFDTALFDAAQSTIGALADNAICTSVGLPRSSTRSTQASCSLEKRTSAPTGKALKCST